MLGATFVIMLAVRTLAGVDLPGAGPRKLPAPRMYVAIIVTWAVLGFVAELGAGWRLLADRLAGLIVLASLVLGPFGAQLTGFLGSVARNFSITSTGVGPATPSTPPGTIYHA
jgi:hypothetical protein